MKADVEITDLDRAEIGRLITEGFTTGRLDCGDGKHINWSIDIGVWVD